MMETVYPFYLCLVTGILIAQASSGQLEKITIGSILASIPLIKTQLMWESCFGDHHAIKAIHCKVLFASIKVKLLSGAILIIYQGLQQNSILMKLVDYQKNPNTIKINVYSTNKKGIYAIRCDGGGCYCYHFKNHFHKANMYCTLWLFCSQSFQQEMEVCWCLRYYYCSKTKSQRDLGKGFLSERRQKMLMKGINA